MSPVTYLGVFRRGWRPLLLAMFLGAVTGLGLSLFSPTSYTTHKLLLLKAGGDAAALDAASQHTITSAQAATLVYYASSTDVRRLIYEAAGLNAQAPRGIDIEVTVPKDTKYIEVAATAPDPAVAGRIAEAMTSTLKSSSGQFAAGSGRGPTLTDVSPQGAAPSIKPPPRILWAFIGALSALGVAYVLLLLRFISRPMLSEADVLGDPRAPFLGIVRSRASDTGLSWEVGGLAGAAGVYRQHEYPPVLLVAGVGERFLDVSLGVANSVARTGRRVLLVDGNVDDSKAAKLPPPDGDNLPQPRTVFPPVDRSSSPNQQVDVLSIVSDQFEPQTIADLIDEWRQDDSYDVIIVNATFSADDESIWLWLDVADSVLLGGVRDRTPVEHFEKALDSMPHEKLRGTFFLAPEPARAGARNNSAREAARHSSFE